jgi:thiol-disulfide isomerase/thioredoxin
MHGLGYAAALVLAAVFVRAAAAKLHDRAGTRRTFTALGLPGSVAGAVPAVELVLALGLVVAPGWSAAVALAVLAAFTTFLWRAVRAGVSVGCNCFGRARQVPVSWVELVRNALLGGTAGVALAAPRPTVPDPGAVLVAAAAVAIGVLIVRGAERRRASGEGPVPGSPAPPLPGAGWEPARTTLVAFLAPGCPRCRAERPLLDGVGAAVRVVDLDAGTRPLFDAYRVRATPFYVLVGPDATVRWRGDVVPPDASADQRAR